MKRKCIVTGCAGFIGSHVTERLLSMGYEIVGIDSFTNYYSPKLKRLNISNVMQNEHFKLIDEDLTLIDLPHILRDVDYVIHEAAQAGVLGSWGDNFEVYLRNNLFATQRLLEACKAIGIKKFVFASSSSVYGNSKSIPLNEEQKCVPFSPYGLTKLACEDLCLTYRENFRIPIVMLRYFSVYGPRQRPDMAFHKFLLSALKEGKIKVFGGNQSRDFTFVDDVVEATVAAMQSGVEGEIINIGSARPISLMDSIKLVKDITGCRLKIEFAPDQKGDVKQTYANIDKAKRLLGYNPRTALPEGLQKEYEWIKSMSSIGVL